MPNINNNINININKKQIEEATSLFLSSLGEDKNREGLIETPERVSRMADELFKGYHQDVKEILSKTFDVQSQSVVIERDIAFTSLCEHHLLPFYGTVTIIYKPKHKVVGLSKLARCVEAYARRLQIQERLTEQIASSIYNYLDCEGVMVICKAKHMCMMMRGVEKRESETITYSYKGIYEDKSNRQEVLTLL